MRFTGLIIAALLALMLCLPIVGVAAEASATAIDLKNGWAMDYNTSVSLMRLEKTDDGIVGRPAAGFGAGLTIFYAPTSVTVISINAPEFILTTRPGDDDALDVLIGGDVGFMDNKIRVGGGWIHNEWVGLISLGL
jgi:hypothetical protein